MVLYVQRMLPQETYFHLFTFYLIVLYDNTVREPLSREKCIMLTKNNVGGSAPAPFTKSFDSWANVMGGVSQD